MMIRESAVWVASVKDKTEKHPRYQYCGAIPGTFPYLHVWDEGEEEVLYCVRGFYDKKYGEACGSCGAGL